MIYNDQSHSIQTNVNNSAKMLYIKLKFSTEAGTLYYPKLPNFNDLIRSSHPIQTIVYNSAKMGDIELKLSEYDQIQYVI